MSDAFPPLVHRLTESQRLGFFESCRVISVIFTSTPRHAFAALLARQRYCAGNGRQKVRLVADLSCWMTRKRLQLQDLDEQRVAIFLEARWRKTPRRSGDKVTMTALLRQLREARAIPLPSAPMPGPVELIQRDFGAFLLQERCLNGLDWAKHRRRKAAAKCHLRLDLQSFLPRLVLKQARLETLLLATAPN